MKRIVVLTLLMGVALTACEEAGVSEEASTEAMAVAPAADASVASRAPTVRADYTPPASVPLLAYSYKYRIEAPAKSIDLLVGKHEAACQAAGPAVCQVTNAEIRRESQRNVTGSLSLRARPDWLAAFRAGLAGDAEGVGGKIAESNTGTDDLSASIVDTEAAIRAKVIMRDRLEDMMARRSGKVSELMDAERQLAEVRSEIDAAQSSLAMMKNRVRMSSITIDYGPKGSLAADDGAWSPVADAVRASQGLAASVVAVMILLVSGLGPIALAGGAIWLLVRRLRRKPAPAAPAA